MIVHKAKKKGGVGTANKLIKTGLIYTRKILHFS